MDPVIITGVPRQHGSVLPPDAPPRLEINDFIKNEQYFSLYIQALRMQNNKCFLIMFNGLRWL
jgi:tyrosinase